MSKEIENIPIDPTTNFFKAPIQYPLKRNAEDDSDAVQKKPRTEVIELDDSDEELRYLDETDPDNIPDDEELDAESIPPPTRTEMTLTPEQQYVVDLVVKQRKSVFFTGNAGTGKSVVTKEIIRLMRKSISRHKLAITATTGLAAVNIGGGTLHSWAGIGLGNQPLHVLIRRVGGNKNAAFRWRETNVLFIDEISMLDAELFDTLEALARAVRNDQRPFGGIQVVCCGDFLQLPPVPRQDPNDWKKKVEVKFCFDANSWKAVIPHTVVLKKVFRQTDTHFIRVLNDMRLGQMTPDSIKAVQALNRNPIYPNDGILPTVLHAKRKDVEDHNRTQLQRLAGVPMIFICEDKKNTDEGKAINLDTATNAPKEVVLKTEAQVILLKNMGQEAPNLVNGSRGVVLGFKRLGDTSKDGMVFDKAAADKAPPSEAPWAPVVKFTDGTVMTVAPHTWEVELNGKCVASRTQHPLALAWSLTVHKAQGQTIDRLEANLADVFEKGQAYVALSRAKDPSSLKVTGFSANKVKAHSRALFFERMLHRQ